MPWARPACLGGREPGTPDGRPSDVRIDLPTELWDPLTTSVWQDYLAIFRALHPECDALPLSRAQYRRLLPFATAIQTLAFFFFLLVEASGGAGGTSLVAGTRTAVLFMLHLALLGVAAVIARSTASLALSNIVLAWTISALLLDAASIGSALSTFGMEPCAPLAPAALGANATNVTLPSSLRCVVDSGERAAKMLFEALFLLILSLPGLLAAFSVVLGIEKGEHIFLKATSAFAVALGIEKGKHIILKATSAPTPRYDHDEASVAPPPYSSVSASPSG
ncbi:hypothetical protein T484DRAFT_1879565, partial [Baffinella frigidus]